MFNQLCECWPICGTIQPAVQHGLVSTSKDKLDYKGASYIAAIFLTTTCKLSPHISVGAYSGGLILVPSLSLLQKDSSMQTPGYGEAPVGDIKQVMLQMFSGHCVSSVRCTGDYQAYPGKRSPREVPQRTKHHFVWCTPDRRWSQEPSTLEEDVPVARKRCQSCHITVLSGVRLIIYVSVLRTHISLADIVRVFVDISSEAKVTDLHHIVL